MSEHEAIRRADDTNMWVGVKELQERIALLEQHIRVVEAENARLRANHKEVVQMLPEGQYMCGHCQVRLATCFGRYDNMEEADFACDECCGHGNEDGRCVHIRDYE